MPPDGRASLHKFFRGRYCRILIDSLHCGGSDDDNGGGGTDNNQLKAVTAMANGGGDGNSQQS
jgi:hypothetical protein